MDRLSQPNKPQYSSHPIWYKSDSFCVSCGSGAPKVSVVQQPGVDVEVVGFHKKNRLAKDNDEEWDDEDWEDDW